MGYTKWSDDAYKARQATLKRQGYASGMVHQHDIAARRTRAGIHEQMNPKGVTRESRDSDAHPKSRAIGVLFDVTGSMGRIPAILQTKLATLMGLLIQKGYVDDPQILFGGIGDALTDRAPLQIGQFETDVAMDKDLGKLWLEGCGGGQMAESYELGMYFMARHTELDCVDKRGEPAYLFLIGDELPRDVSATAVEAIIGDTLEADIPIEDILAELRERYEVFFVYVPSGSYGSRQSAVPERWKELLPERVVELDDFEAVSETIAGLIGMCEGVVDVDKVASDLASMGDSAASAAESVSKALVPLAGGLVKAGSVSGDLQPSQGSGVTRI